MYKNIGIIIVIALIVGGAIFLFIKEINKEREYSKTPVATSTTPGEAPVVLVSKTLHEKNAEAGYEVNATYPEVSNFRDKVMERQINRIIEQKVIAHVESFKSSTRESRRVDESDISTLDIGYQQEKLTSLPHILGFRLTQSYFEVGAAHPGQTTETFNFDLRTGKVITLDDLFEPQSGYLDIISAHSIRELKNRLGAGAHEQIEYGARPVPENYEAFLITDSGIRIIFNQYQAAAYAAGEQEVLVPYLELFDVLSKDGPLGMIVQ